MLPEASKNSDFTFWVKGSFEGPNVRLSIVARDCMDEATAFIGPKRVSVEARDEYLVTTMCVIWPIALAVFILASTPIQVVKVASEYEAVVICPATPEVL